MKKTIFFIVFMIIMILNLSAQSYTESAAGSITVAKQKVGVLIVDPQSYLWPLSWASNPSKTIMSPDSFFTIGLKAEIIKKGGDVMILNPPGMEKILSPFLVMKGGQMDVKEIVAASSPIAFNKAFTQLNGEGVQLLQSLFNVTEFSNESYRIDQFAEFYRKIINLWGISKLITIEGASKYSIIVRGYEIEGASAALVFQYYLKTDSTMFGNNIKTKIQGNRVAEGDFLIVDSEKVKPEDSDIRTYEVIKRVSSYLR